MSYDSNVFSRNDATSDLILSLGPVVALERARGLLHLTGTLDGRYEYFLEDPDLSSFALSARAQLDGLHRPGSPLFFDLSLSYDDSERAQSEIGDRTRTQNAFAGGTVSYTLSPKLAARSTLSLSQQIASRAGLSDSTRRSLALDALYAYSPKLFLFSGYRYQEIRYDVASAFRPDNATHTVYLGAEGDLLPKVSGSLSLGVQKLRDADTAFYYSLGLAWAATQKVSVALSGSSDNTASLTGATNRSKSLSLTLRHQLLREIGYSVGLSWGTLESESFFGTREDHYWTLSLGGSYALSDRIGLGASLSFTDRESEGFFTVGTYTRTTATLSASWRF